jgi:MFS family permease
MVVLDATIVNIALPSIRRDLHFSVTGLEWVINAYALALRRPAGSSTFQ